MAEAGGPASQHLLGHAATPLDLAAECCYLTDFVLLLFFEPGSCWVTLADWTLLRRPERSACLCSAGINVSPPRPPGRRVKTVDPLPEQVEYRTSLPTGNPELARPTTLPAATHILAVCISNEVNSQVSE